MATINSAIGTFLGWLDRLTGNYVIALFLFAIIVEIVLLPLGIKQQKNSIRQAKLRPKEMAIRKKYAGRNDQATQQKVTMEIQELYQRENFNPMGGCLPLLIQLPIILILYNVVVNPMKHLLGMSDEIIKTIQSYMTTAVADGGLGLELAGKSSGSNTIEMLSKIKTLGPDAFGTLQEFVHRIDGTTYLGSDAYAALMESFEAGMPDFSFLGIDLGAIPSITNPSILWLIPILTFVVYFASMKVTRKFTYQPTVGNDQQAACSNTMMDVTMPLMSVYFTFLMPAAIGVYWMFKSVLTTIKQIILHKVMPAPQFTEEDYKAAEKEMAGKPGKKTADEQGAPANHAAMQGGIAPVRSLHHIDDEDFEDTREQAEIRKRLIEEAQQKAQQEKEKKSRIPGMKETNRHDKKDEAAEDDDQNN